MSHTLIQLSQHVAARRWLSGENANELMELVIFNLCFSAPVFGSHIFIMLYSAIGPAQELDARNRPSGEKHVKRTAEG